MTQKIAYYAYPIFFIVVIFLLAHFLGGVLLPLILSFFLAYLCHPIVRKLQKWGLSHDAAVFLTFSGSFLILSCIGIFALPLLIHKAILFILGIPSMLVGLLASFENIANGLGFQFHVEPSMISELIQKELKTISISTISTMSLFLKDMVSNMVKTFTWFLCFLLFPVLFYHALAKINRIKKELQEFVPKRHHPFLATLSKVFDKVLSSYIRGQFIVCSLLAFLFSFGLWLVQLKYGVLIGVMTGYMMVIPYVGFGVGLVTGMTIAISSGYTLDHIAMVLGVFLIIQALESFIITPKIMGNKIGLDPFVTLLSIIIGGHLLGLLGILIAVPTSGILNHFYGTLKENYQNSDFFLKP